MDKVKHTYLWTFTSQYIHNSSEEINQYPTWLVWDNTIKMRDFILKSLSDDLGFILGRDLNNNELTQIKNQLYEFIDNDVKESRENELTITLLNYQGEEEEYYVIRVWTMALMKEDGE